MRLLSILVFLPALLAAQDPREIVRRSLELDKRNEEIARSYTFLQRQEQKQVDSKGNVKDFESNTWDITLLEGSPYKRLVSHNDKPIPPREQKKEEEKLQASIEQRRKETKEQREARIADWDRHQQQRREPLKEIPEAFDFKVAQQETQNGSQVYVIDATPKPGYRPKLTSAAFFPKVKMRMWINARDYQWSKIDLETLDTIAFGGFLIRLAKGTHLILEQEYVNNEVWLRKLISIRGSARILLVKGFHGELNTTYSDYKKFQTESRVVSSQ